jgi:hypothetical protein
LLATNWPGRSEGQKQAIGVADEQLRGLDPRLVLLEQIGGRGVFVEVANLVLLKSASATPSRWARTAD